MSYERRKIKIVDSNNKFEKSSLLVKQSTVVGFQRQ